MNNKSSTDPKICPPKPKYFAQAVLDDLLLLFNLSYLLRTLL